MTINKSDINYKIGIKNYYKKRKKGIFEDGSVHYTNRDAGENKGDKICELNKKDNLKVYVEKLIY